MLIADWTMVVVEVVSVEVAASECGRPPPCLRACLFATQQSFDWLVKQITLDGENQFVVVCVAKQAWC